MCLNGAASRLVEVGDVIIIMTYAQLNEDEMVDHSPKVAVLNENNEIIEMINEKRKYDIKCIRNEMEFVLK